LDSNTIVDISALSDLENLENLLLLDVVSLNIFFHEKSDKFKNSFKSQNSELTDITPIARLTLLSRLWLHENNITDISPLKGLKNLRELRLENNDITDISALKGLNQP